MALFVRKHGQSNAATRTVHLQIGVPGNLHLRRTLHQPDLPFDQAVSAFVARFQLLGYQGCVPVTRQTGYASVRCLAAIQKANSIVTNWQNIFSLHKLVAA